MDTMTSILTIAIVAGASLVFATIGEIFTERSGILNLGVEGMMIIGAVTAFAAAYHSESAWVGVLVALLAGGAMALIHAFLTISLRADQVVSGLALTLFGTGLASFLGQRLGAGGTPLVGLIGPRFRPVAIPGLSDLPVVGPVLFNQDLLVYLMYALVPLSWYFLYKTRPGLHLRAVGESPQTADALGISVFKLRYFYTMVGGMLAGLGGAHLSLAYTPGWTEHLTGGRGWIAIALVIFATWDPLRAVVGALLFGGVNAIQ
jgi:simple sugar transport system permease protein